MKVSPEQTVVQKKSFATLIVAGKASLGISLNHEDDDNKGFSFYSELVEEFSVLWRSCCLSILIICLFSLASLVYILVEIKSFGSSSIVRIFETSSQVMEYDHCLDTTGALSYRSLFRGVDLFISFCCMWFFWLFLSYFVHTIVAPERCLHVLKYRLLIGGLLIVLGFLFFRFYTYPADVDGQNTILLIPVVHFFILFIPDISRVLPRKVRKKKGFVIIFQSLISIFLFSVITTLGAYVLISIVVIPFMIKTPIMEIIFLGILIPILLALKRSYFHFTLWKSIKNVKRNAPKVFTMATCIVEIGLEVQTAGLTFLSWFFIKEDISFVTTVILSRVMECLVIWFSVSIFTSIVFIKKLRIFFKEKAATEKRLKVEVETAREYVGLVIKSQVVSEKLAVFIGAFFMQIMVYKTWSYIYRIIIVLVVELIEDWTKSYVCKKYGVQLGHSKLPTNNEFVLCTVFAGGLTLSYFFFALQAPCYFISQ